jgi:hypothetical protein
MLLELHGHAIWLRATAVIGQARQTRRATSSFMAPFATERIGAQSLDLPQAAFSMFFQA